jgi:hypothetical protein
MLSELWRSVRSLALVRGGRGRSTPSRARKPRASRLKLAVVLAIGSGLVVGCGGGGSDEPIDLASGTVELNDQGWYCSGKVDMDRVAVTIESVDIDAIHLGRGCTGTIREIEVVQHQVDGVKVSEGAHDLVVEKGVITCVEQKPGSHQDGVQVMGGARITFRELNIDCPTRSSGFFVRLGGRGSEPPTDVVCEECEILGGGYSVRVNESVRSGVRNSTVCEGSFGAIKILAGAVEPVDVGNRRVLCD